MLDRSWWVWGARKITTMSWVRFEAMFIRGHGNRHRAAHRLLSKTTVSSQELEEIVVSSGRGFKSLCPEFDFKILVWSYLKQFPLAATTIQGGGLLQKSKHASSSFIRTKVSLEKNFQQQKSFIFVSFSSFFSRKCGTWDDSVFGFRLFFTKEYPLRFLKTVAF